MVWLRDKFSFLLKPVRRLLTTKYTNPPLQRGDLGTVQGHTQVPLLQPLQPPEKSPPPGVLPNSVPPGKLQATGTHSYAFLPSPCNQCLSVTAPIKSFLSFKPVCKVLPPSNFSSYSPREVICSCNNVSHRYVLVVQTHNVPSWRVDRKLCATDQSHHALQS